MWFLFSSQLLRGIIMLEEQVLCCILSMCHSLYVAMPVKLILASIYATSNYLNGVGAGRGRGKKCAVKFKFQNFKSITSYGNQILITVFITAHHYFLTWAHLSSPQTTTLSI